MACRLTQPGAGKWVLLLQMCLEAVSMPSCLPSTPADVKVLHVCCRLGTWQVKSSLRCSSSPSHQQSTAAMAESVTSLAEHPQKAPKPWRETHQS